MRVFLLLLMLAPPAFAWEAGNEGAICTLTHSDDTGDTRLTYDPAGPLYSITVTRAEPWPDSPWFAMRFAGAQPNVISTNRHRLGRENRALSVEDTGFGNVLDGLEFNDIAYAFVDGAVTEINLEGIEEPMQIFRACAAAGLA